MPQWKCLNMIHLNNFDVLKDEVLFKIGDITYPEYPLSAFERMRSNNTLHILNELDTTSQRYRQPVEDCFINSYNLARNVNSNDGIEINDNNLIRISITPFDEAADGSIYYVFCVYKNM